MWLALVLTIGTIQPDAVGAALVAAARAGDEVRVREILAAGGDVDATDAEGRTALMAAAARDDAALVTTLLEAGADVSLRDAEGVSALTVAKAAGAEAVVKLLRDAGAEESAEERLDAAIRAGDRDGVERAIADGADVDALDVASYQTPLMTALEHRELDILSLLLEAGADPTREGTGIATSGESAITVAAREGSPWAFRQLIRAGARSRDLERALFAGCTYASIVEIAVEAGANVDTRDERRWTPLICAASQGATEAVSVLLKLGAARDRESKDGRTALDWAKLRGHRDVVALLETAR